MKITNAIKHIRVTWFNSAGVEMGILSNPLSILQAAWVPDSAAATITKVAVATKYYVVGGCDGMSDAIATFECKIGAATIWKLAGVPANTQVGKLWGPSGVAIKVINEAVTLTCSAGTYNINLHTNLITP